MYACTHPIFTWQTRRDAAGCPWTVDVCRGVSNATVSGNDQDSHTCMFVMHSICACMQVYDCFRKAGSEMPHTPPAFIFSLTPPSTSTTSVHCCQIQPIPVTTRTLEREPPHTFTVTCARQRASTHARTSRSGNRRLGAEGPAGSQDSICCCFLSQPGPSCSCFFGRLSP